MTIKTQLLQDRAKLIVNAQAILAEKDFTKEKEAEADRMLKEADNIKARIDLLDKADAQAAALSKPQDFLAGREGPTGHADGEKAERAMKYAGAFDKFMRFGKEELSNEEVSILRGGVQQVGREHLPQNALTSGVPAAGGYTVPQDFQSEMDVAIKEFVGVEQAGAQVLTTGNGQDILWPTANDSANKGRIIAEGGSTSPVDPNFGQINLKAHIYTSDLIVVSLQLLQDTEVNLIEFIKEIAAERIGRIQNEHFTTGDNTNKPQGLIPSIPVGATVTKSGTFSAANPFGFDDIVDLKFKVDNGYRKVGSFMASDDAVKVIVKIKDGENRPLFLPSARDGEPDRLLNRPLFWNNEMAAPAIGAIPLVYGDMSKYKIRRVGGGGLIRMDQPYNGNFQCAFIYFQRADGRVVNAGTNPIAALKMPAS